MWFSIQHGLTACNGGLPAIHLNPRSTAKCRASRSTPASSADQKLPVMAGVVMLFEQVLAEIAREIAPDGMDVVGVILRIVHFNEERRRLHAVVVWVAPIDATGPGKKDVLARLVKLRDAVFGQFVRDVVRVLFDERH